MQCQVTLGTRNTLARGLFHLLLAPERPQNSNQHEQGLIVVRLDVCGALEMPCRVLEVPLSKAGPGKEITGFEQVRIEFDRSIELCHCFRIAFGKRESEATRRMRLGETALQID